MFTHVSYVMVNVSDMPRSVAFYRDTLGLPLKFDTPGWSEFDTGTTILALHLAPRPDAQRAPSAEPIAGTCAIGFSVDDLDGTWKTLQGRGVQFVMPPTLLEQDGIRLAVCLDPDGLGISFAEAVPQTESSR